MASLEEKLALSKKMTHMESVAPQQMQTQPQYTFNNPREVVKQYNAKEDLKRLQSGLPKDLSGCKLPQSILESIISNPLTDFSANTEMDKFTETLGESLGIQQSANIIEHLDKREKKVNETIIPTQSKNLSVDYEMIKLIIENVIDKKLETLQQSLLTENRMNNTSNCVKTMHFGEKFMFCDSDDNVYECEMVYKGKRKRK